jgi:hypothetical protein
MKIMFDTNHIQDGEEYYHGLDIEIPSKKILHSLNDFVIPHDSELFTCVSKINMGRWNFSKLWLTSTELEHDDTFREGEEESDRMIYLTISTTAKLSAFFAKIRSTFDNEKAQYEEEFESFCTRFTKAIMGLFSDISVNKQYIKGDFSEICDWLMIYYSCYAKSQLFSICLIESNFYASERLEYFLFRKTNSADYNLINKICSYPENFMSLMDILGKQKMWELMCSYMGTDK